ncbi:hypothetical protein PCANC_08096 [Puccinia coronata f. sp. avenae]|uniref:Uncharacterized protein n=1 Tax=Puccinia coronata f. sp. avenae TaxID=200324 RepID=A0A2N5SI39_9BASI|nr:hypothetical protein PCANC_17529 [Puccinia coronata f. sp. avenae]PLW44538.1 hypothetical protein PCANC_08096 [Puccinia coronata f. sp. avenae]
MLEYQQLKVVATVGCSLQTTLPNQPVPASRSSVRSSRGTRCAGGGLNARLWKFSGQNAASLLTTTRCQLGPRRQDLTQLAASSPSLQISAEWIQRLISLSAGVGVLAIYHKHQNCKHHSIKDWQAPLKCLGTESHNSSSQGLEPSNSDKVTGAVIQSS